MVYVTLTMVAIILSAFFSGMEIAFLSSNRLKLELERNKNRFLSPMLSIYLNKPEQFISTLLIGNNLALVIYGISLAILIEPIIEIINPNVWFMLVVQTIISTIIILFLGEFLPKILFRINPNKTLKLFSLPIYLFYLLLYPLALLTTWLSKTFVRMVDKSGELATEFNSAFDRDDLSDLVAQNTQKHKAAGSSSTNATMLQKALEFKDITVRECMVPRKELLAVSIDTEIPEIIQKFNQSGFSRILVFEGNTDNILGYVHVSDMFSNPTSLKGIIHQIPIVPESMPANKLLQKLIKQHKSIALVVDEFGGTSGIVTLEDILEEILGEIRDEHDITTLEEKQVDQNRYIFSGRLEIDYLNEKYGFSLEESDHYETLAGYIIHHLRTIPKTNQTIALDRFQFKILKATGNQISTVEMTIATN